MFDPSNAMKNLKMLINFKLNDSYFFRLN